MPALSAEDRASRRADLEPQITTDPVQVTIARAPKGLSRQGGAEAIATDVPMRIWPASGNSDPRVLAAVPDIGGARVSAIGYAAAATDIQSGDEVWARGTAYKVTGTGVWNASVAVALNEVKPTRPGV